jgi:tyrosinase
VVVKANTGHRGDLSKDDRKEYIRALLCLMEAKPKLTQFPGVTNRYEDFVAVHINQTMAIHGTGSFLSWHRLYLWEFERVSKRGQVNGATLTLVRRH